MPSNDEKRFEVTGLLKGNAVSRREFLKVAGVAGATVGAGARPGGLLAACGGSTTTTATGLPLQARPPRAATATTTATVDDHDGTSHRQ